MAEEEKENTLSNIDKKFLHISFTANEETNFEEIKKKLDYSKDWVQYIPGCFIIKTLKSVNSWYLTLKDLIGESNNIFICKIDLNERQGWLPEWVWDWIYKNTSE